MVCKNCKTKLNETQNFCFQCGAKVIRNRLTPKVLAQQVNEEFLSIDNKFLQTFIDLFKKPEDVIDGYINGLRKRYVGVIPYYALALTVLGFQVYLLQNFFPEFFESQGNAMAGGLVEQKPNPVSQVIQDFMVSLNQYQGILFSALIPLIAIGSWIVYLDKRTYNYTEHLVINLYSNAQMIAVNFVLYMALALSNVKDYITASLIITPITLLYGSYVFKRIYKTSFINALLRYLGAFIIYMFVFTIIMFAVMIVLVIYLFVTGKINT